LRRRFALVRRAVRLVLSIQASVSRAIGRVLSGNALKQISGAQLEALFPDPTTFWRAGAVQALADFAGAHCRTETLDPARSTRSDLLVRLQSVPGIGPILGTTILLETGDIGRFASVGDYASYCRMVESVRLFNGKLKGHGNRKCGNRYLCWAYIEAANFAARHNTAIRRWYERKRTKKHRVVAIKTVAHKLARACYHMLREGSAFQPARAFGRFHVGGRRPGTPGCASNPPSEWSRPPAPALQAGPRVDRATNGWAFEPATLCSASHAPGRSPRKPTSVWQQKGRYRDPNQHGDWRAPGAESNATDGGPQATGIFGKPSSDSVRYPPGKT
jgi:hypothetical protein